MLTHTARMQNACRHAYGDVFFLGMGVGRTRDEPEHGVPVCAHRSVLAGNVLVDGQTQSSKTSRAAKPLTEFLAGGYRGGGLGPGEPCVVVDLKGSPDLAANCRAFAAMHGIPFKFFSCDENERSHAFNPFLTADPVPWRSQVEMLLASQTATGDIHKYGARHFELMARELTTLAVSKRPDAQCFEHLVEVLEGRANGASLRLSRHQLEHASDSISVLRNLAAVGPLNVTEGPLFENRIDFADLYRRPGPQIYYFDLSPALLPSLSSEIASLVVYAAYRAAYMAYRRTGVERRVWFIADEFHRCPSPFRLILEQGAEAGTRCALLAQNAYTQLEACSRGLGTLVADQCSVHWSFKIADRETRERQSRDSGLRYDFQYSFTDGTSSSVSHQNSRTVGEYTWFEEDPTLWEHAKAWLSGEEAQPQVVVFPGGQVSRTSGTTRTYGHNHSVTRKQIEVPKFTPEQLLQLGIHPGYSYVKFRQGTPDVPVPWRGELVALRHYDWHISPEERLRRRRIPWREDDTKTRVFLGRLSSSGGNGAGSSAWKRAAAQSTSRKKRQEVLV